MQDNQVIELVELADPPRTRTSTVAAAQAREDDVLLELVAASVEPLDRQVATGAMPMSTAPLRGGVSAIARRVGTAHGDQLVAVHASSVGMGVSRDGTYARQFCAPSSAVVPLSSELIPEPIVAAAALVAVSTAHLAVHHHGRVEAGTSVLVLGASGGVGVAAAGLAAAAGADVTAVMRRTDGWSGPPDVRVMTLETFMDDDQAGAGADVVIDPVGGSILTAAATRAGQDCRHIVVGYSAGTATTLVIPLLIAHQHRFVFLNKNAHPYDILAEATIKGLAAVRDGTVPPPSVTPVGFDEPHALYAKTSKDRNVLVATTPKRGRD